MHHAISNAGSLESDYYRRETLAHVASLRKERIDQRCNDLRDALDAKDIFDVLGDDEHKLMALCEALLPLVIVYPHRLEGPYARAIAEALQNITEPHIAAVAAKEYAA